MANMIDTVSIVSMPLTSVVGGPSQLLRAAEAIA
jgi:hypothetical protein